MQIAINPPSKIRLQNHRVTEFEKSELDSDVGGVDGLSAGVDEG
jgi:hypothetical protein